LLWGDKMYFNKLKGSFFIERKRRNFYVNMKEPHYHEHYEIYFLLSGNRKYFINHSIYNVTKGDIITIENNVLHKTIAVSSDVHERIVLNFTPEFIMPVLNDEYKITLLNCFKEHKFSIPPNKRDYVLFLFTRMNEEFQNNCEFSYDIIRHYLFELLVFLNKCSQANKELTVKLNISEERIRNAAKYICDNYNKRITLQDAANIAFMSPTYFSKKFRKTTGFRFTEYLNNIRIIEACKLLTTTNYSITDIAFMCGFNDSNYFGEVFRKMKKTSPTNYRIKHG